MILASAPDPRPRTVDWIDESRWPRRPYCSDDLGSGVRVRSLRQAVEKVYIQANPPHLRCWSIFDCDFPGAAGVWLEKDLPAPTWITINRVNTHAHLVWGISAPVLMDGEGLHQGPVRYLAAIENGLRAAVNGDPGYSGLLTKNPAHPRWDTRQLGGLYELAKLAESVNLKAHKPKRGTDAAEYGLLRNCTLFDRLRVWAYVSIRLYRGAGRTAPGAYLAWLNECYRQSLAYNEFPSPLAMPEARHVGRSVARWVWARDPAELQAFQDRQAFKGRRSGAARRRASADLRAQAVAMREEGASTRAIAAALDVPKSTIGRWVSHEPKSGNSAPGASGPPAAAASGPDGAIQGEPSELVDLVRKRYRVDRYARWGPIWEELRADGSSQPVYVVRAGLYVGDTA
jgi:transposase-like protein